MSLTSFDSCSAWATEPAAALVGVELSAILEFEDDVKLVKAKVRGEKGDGRAGCSIDLDITLDRSRERMSMQRPD